MERHAGERRDSGFRAVKVSKQVGRLSRAAWAVHGPPANSKAVRTFERSHGLPYFSAPPRPAPGTADLQIGSGSQRSVEEIAAAGPAHNYFPTTTLNFSISP